MPAFRKCVMIFRKVQIGCCCNSLLSVSPASACECFVWHAESKTFEFDNLIGVAKLFGSFLPC